MLAMWRCVPLWQAGLRLPAVCLLPAMHLRAQPTQALPQLPAGCHGREHQAGKLVMSAHPCCPQVSIVGDLDPAELEECVLKYLGTVNPEPKVRVDVGDHPGFRTAPGLCGNDTLRLGSHSSPTRLAQRCEFSLLTSPAAHPCCVRRCRCPRTRLCAWAGRWPSSRACRCRSAT